MTDAIVINNKQMKGKRALLKDADGRGAVCHWTWFIVMEMKTIKKDFLITTQRDLQQ